MHFEAIPNATEDYSAMETVCNEKLPKIAINLEGEGLSPTVAIEQQSFPNPKYDFNNQPVFEKVDHLVNAVKNHRSVGKPEQRSAYVTGPSKAFHQQESLESSDNLIANEGHSRAISMPRLHGSLKEVHCLGVVTSSRRYYVIVLL